MRSPFEIKSFKDFIDSKPPEESYAYVNQVNCLICQYFHSIGLKFQYVTNSHWCTENLERHPLPAGFNKIAGGDPPYLSCEWTYGKASARAGKMLEKA